MISYSSIVGYGSGKATLPSVETWGSNMNILRDPPKSIYTRKIDKVGETSEITQMIQDSGDRACEAINVYARGVNPMVAVSYDNFGNNGGQRSGGIATAGLNVGGGNSGKQSFLPYRIMNGGSFRPPIRDQRDLLPLSRLPRIWTSSFTQPGFKDFSKRAMCQGTDMDTKGVKKPDQMLKACVRPTATYQIQTPVIETYEVKNVIKNPIKIQGNSGINPVAKFNAEHGETFSAQIIDPLRVDVNINSSGDYIKDADLSGFNTEKYTQETLHSNVQSNNSSNIQITSIDEIYNMDVSNNIKENFNINYTAPYSSTERQKYIHDDINLQRTLPYYESRTNTGLNIHKGFGEMYNEREYVPNRPSTSAFTNIMGIGRGDDNETQREYRLKPTINPGGFDGIPNIPGTHRDNNIQEFDRAKTQMRQKIYEMSQARNETVNSIPYRID